MGLLIHAYFGAVGPVRIGSSRLAVTVLHMKVLNSSGPANKLPSLLS